MGGMQPIGGGPPVWGAAFREGGAAPSDIHPWDTSQLAKFDEKNFDTLKQDLGDYKKFPPTGYYGDLVEWGNSPEGAKVRDTDTFKDMEYLLKVVIDGLRQHDPDKTFISKLLYGGEGHSAINPGDGSIAWLAQQLKNPSQ